MKSQTQQRCLRSKLQVPNNSFPLSCPHITTISILGRKIQLLLPELYHPSCSGILCDRHSKYTSCGCLKQDPVSSWVMGVRPVTEGVENLDEDLFSHENMFFSRALTVCVLGKLILKQAADSVNIQGFETLIERNVKSVNSEGGWIVSGYYKCAAINGDRDTVGNLKKARVISIEPVKPIIFVSEYNPLDYISR